MVEARSSFLFVGAGKMMREDGIGEYRSLCHGCTKVKSRQKRSIILESAHRLCL